MRARCGAFRYFPAPLDDGTALKAEGKILHYVQNDGNSRKDSSLSLRMTIVGGEDPSAPLRCAQDDRIL